RSRGGKWCMAIENKIGSRESKGQLKRCLAAIEADMPGAAVIPVFLTLEGNDPSDEGKRAGYVSLSYDQVLEVAERVIEQHKSRIPGDATMFLHHYLQTVGRLTMHDDELIKLCKAIYHRHREAIDLIVEYGSASLVLDACEMSVKQAAQPEF